MANVFVTGTEGNDVFALISSKDNITVTAFAGDDLIATGSGNDFVIAGSGNDTIPTREGNDTIDGGDGNDLVVGQEGDDSIDGGAGNDLLSGGPGNDIIISGLGNDTINGGDGNDTIDLSAGIKGELKVVFAEAGNDIIIGGNAVDSIDAGDGDDFVSAGAGDDVFTGEGGNDTLIGGDGNDLIVGGSGNDRIFGDAGNDLLFGVDGIDLLNGGDGNDNLDGGDGNDNLDGGNGDDVLIGGNGDDVLIGGDGNDNLQGDAGSDTLNGGAGADRLNGVNPIVGTSSFGKGEIDVLTGGQGKDTFVLGDKNAVYYNYGNPSSSVNQDFSIIKDFQSRSDRNLLVQSVSSLPFGTSIFLTGASNILPELNGVNPIVGTSSFGKGEIDVLTGGQGRNTLLLGDNNAVYYNDGNRLFTGNKDYAIIKDFQSQFDSIELKGSASDYLLGQSAGSLPFGTSIFFTGGSNISAELIGLIEGQSATNFNLNNTNQFSFV